MVGILQWSSGYHSVFTAVGPGLILGQATKIPYVAHGVAKNKHINKNKRNINKPMPNVVFTGVHEETGQKH